MQEADLLKDLEAICGENAVFKDVPMNQHTTMKVGGKADFMVLPPSLEAVQRCISYFNEGNVPFLVIGNGSNLIFTDDGYRGAIIKIGPNLSKIEVMGNVITAEGGSSLAAVANRALEHSLTGFEFASGIPGSIGGAAFMNAGAYDGEMKQVVSETLCIDQSGCLVTLKGDEHHFTYRHSRIQDDGLTCVKVILKLNKGNYEEIKAKMNDLNSRRRDKQPLNFPSAGSVFKRPQGYFAAKLIEDCGLKGCTIGGAQVSEKHSGFIINIGNATASDVLSLIRHVQNTVYEKTGVTLETEVKIIGGA